MTVETHYLFFGGLCRVEAFIEHQDTCKARMTNYMSHFPAKAAPPFSHNTCFSPGFSREMDLQKNHPDHGTAMLMQKNLDSAYINGQNNSGNITTFSHNLELELFSSSNSSLSGMNFSMTTPAYEENHQTGQSHYQENEGEYSGWYNTNDAWIQYSKESLEVKEMQSEAFRLRNEARELSRVAMEEKALAAEKRHQAKSLIEMAKQEMAKAKKIREQAFAEFNAVQILKDCATRHVGSNFVQITCNACRKEFVQEKPSHHQLRVPSHLPF